MTLSSAGEGPSASPSPPPSPILRVEGLSKHFGGAVALDDVSLAVCPQEVHGLLGQNGSGKSTLIKVLAGFHDPDPGARLWVNGDPVRLPVPPGGFRALGISFVHQHLGLIPSLTVLENFLLGDLSTEPRLWVDWSGEAKRTREVFARYGLHIEPEQTVGDLSPVERALLALVRAFDELRRARLPAGHHGLMILDEPTPFLPAGDVERLFRLVRDIVRDGASVIFVSHDIDEVLEITDRATVLRDGRAVGTFETKAVTKDDIVEMIVGHRVEQKRAAGPARGRAAPSIGLRGLSGGVIRDVTLDAAKGEVVGLTGLIGSGYDDAIHLAYGSRPAEAGLLELDGARYDLTDMSPAKAIKAGCVLIPGDRQNAGAVSTLTVLDNISLPVLGRVTSSWAVSDRKLGRNAQDLTRRFDVRPPDVTYLLGSLSGGNQQKVVLAKWFQMTPRLILLDEPTQGVDVGAREQVFAVIREAVAEGACVLCASSDFEQLEAICDRVLIFSRGQIVSELSGDQVRKVTIAEQCYLGAEGAMETIS